MTRETHHTRCTQAAFLKWYSALCPLLLLRSSPSFVACVFFVTSRRTVIRALFPLCLCRLLCLSRRLFLRLCFDGRERERQCGSARVVQIVTFRAVLVGAWRLCFGEYCRDVCWWYGYGWYGWFLPSKLAAWSSGMILAIVAKRRSTWQSRCVIRGFIGVRVEESKFSTFSSPVCLIVLMIDAAVTWKAFLPCLHRVANSSELRFRVCNPSCHGHPAVTCSVSGPPEEYTII